MTQYAVSQGDCLSSIAYAFGFTNWQTIYNDPNNATFRSLRPNPNVIFPGDQLFIPDLDQRVEQGGTDQLHSFQLSLPPVLLQIVLLDQQHNPLANLAYTLVVAGQTLQGQTGGDGLLEQPIPPNATQGTLNVTLPPELGDTGYTWNLQLGSLDPETEVTGVQARLNNLGYNTGPVDGIQGPRTTDAIQQFQAKYGLDVDGVVGPITRSKLVEVHGC